MLLGWMFGVGGELEDTPAHFGKPDATFLVVSNPHTTAGGEVQVYLL